jgi:hypothetical protein
MGELKVMTGIFVLTIASYALSSLYSNEYTKDRAISDAGRNEGSTPRSFILPATPAVALIQEEKVRLKENERLIKRCLLALHDLGYFIRDLDDIYDDNIPVLLLRYQMQEKIEKTAKLDPTTISNLVCG